MREFFVLDKLNSLARQRSAPGDTIAARLISRAWPNSSFGTLWFFDRVHQDVRPPWRLFTASQFHSFIEAESTGLGKASPPDASEGTAEVAPLLAQMSFSVFSEVGFLCMADVSARNAALLCRREHDFPDRGPRAKAAS